MQYLLIVDDEEGVRRSLKRALEKEGYGIFLAESGEEAIDIVKDRPLDIGTIISDFRMPGKNGLETLIEIGRLNPESTRIILTGYATLEAAVESVNEGIDGFLLKPFSNSEIRAKVKECTVKKKLKQFVSDQVYERMCRGLEWMKFRRCVVTVLFCDIRGFSRMSEDLSKEDLSLLLNADFFSPLDDIVCDCGGMLDKHIGDSIMAVFGVFGDEDTAAQKAFLCGERMIERISTGIEKKTTQSLGIGIGIATGEVMAGMFGSSRKREYTVFGPAVNVAARLESIAEPGEILICEDTRSVLGDNAVVRKKEGLSLKGMARSVKVFSIVPHEKAPAKWKHEQS